MKNGFSWLLAGLYGIALVQFQHVALLHLGLKPHIVPMFILALFVGGTFNIPVWDRTVIYIEDPTPAATFQFPAVAGWHPTRQVLALNLGGCLLPLLLSLILMRKMGAECLPPVMAVAAGVALVARLSSSVGGAGIVLLPLPSALCAVIIAGLVAPVEIVRPIAFCGAMWGVLVGADLIRVPQLLKQTCASSRWAAPASLTVWSSRRCWPACSLNLRVKACKNRRMR